MNGDIRADVYSALQRLRGLEPLKELFWQQLNYDRVNQPLSRDDWPKGADQALSEDPILFGQAGDFHIFYCRLASDRLRLTDERAVVNRLLREYPYALFAFSNSSQDRWHFVNVKERAGDAVVAKSRTVGRLLRRIAIGPEERLRTATERISMLDVAQMSPDDSGLWPLVIQGQHDKAFDVEAVTREFYTEYRRVFEERVEPLIRGFAESEHKRLFTQRLFNRMMFIAFIQKKGWLKLNGETDYLSALWKAYEKDGSPEGNFYCDRLKLLFFARLNTPNAVDIIGINRGGFLKELIGDVPYLNGGLFEQGADDRREGVVVPDDCIRAILEELFERFNFTVTESTPLDIEVAVDPEMLGKIFEELVTGRHESGSYYTRKPVVAFMCREALKEYLGGAVPLETDEAVARFVDERAAEGIVDPEGAGSTTEGAGL